MAKPTIMGEVEKRINGKLGEIPRPMKITITKVYSDNMHVDAKTADDEKLEYVRAIGNNLTVDHIGVLFFLDDDSMMIISK